MTSAANGSQASGSSTSFTVRNLRLASALETVSWEELPPLDPSWSEMSVDVIARMLEDLQLGPAMRVLVVEPLSGFLPVLLSRLCPEVSVISSDGRCAVALREQLDTAGVQNVQVHTFLDEPQDGESFDRMIVVRPANEGLGPVLQGMLSARGCAMWSVDSHNMPPRRVRRLLLLDGGEQIEEDLDLEHFSPLLGDMLVDAGVVMRQEVAEALETANKHGRRLGEELVDRGSVSERELYRVLGKQHGTGYVDAANVIGRLDVELVHQLPRKYLDYNMCLPICRMGDRLAVATADVSLSVEDLESLFECEAIVRELITPTDLQRIWVAIELGLVGRATANGGAAVAASEPQRSSAAAGDMLEQLVVAMRDAGATSAHVEHRPGGVLTRFRVDGRLVGRSDWQPDEAAVAELLAAFRAEPQQIVRVRGKDVTCCGTRVVHRAGEDLSVRLLDAPDEDVRIEHLGLPGDVADGYRDAIGASRGLVLVGGPSRSGRSITVRAAAAELREDESRRVITVDAHAARAHANEAFGSGVAAAIRAAAAADADAVCVEIEADAEAAIELVRAAQAGLVVVAVVSGNSAAEALDRLNEQGVSWHAIADNVQSVLVQHLANRTCPACSGKGCEHCSHTGERGRVPVVESLPMTGAIRRAIRSGVAPHDLNTIATQSGMVTMADSARALANRGEISNAEAARLIGDETTGALAALPPLPGACS